MTFKMVIVGGRTENGMGGVRRKHMVAWVIV